MTEASYWDVPADAEVVRHGVYGLTSVHPGAPAEAAVLPAHDPAAARRFAESFGTVETVLEDLGTIETDFESTRADLELVRVGSWGNVTTINDPGLVHVDGFYPVDEEAESLAQRFPESMIVAYCTIDYNLTYGVWRIIHPDGTRLFAAGWSGEDDWELEGSPTEVAAAFGITEQELADADIDMDEDANVFYWEALCDLVVRKVASADPVGRTMSVFRVRHTTGATGRMEEIWLEK